MRRTAPTALCAGILASVVVYFVLTGLVIYDFRRLYRGFEPVTDPKGRTEVRDRMGAFAPLVGPADTLWCNPTTGQVMFRRSATGE